MAPTVRKGLRTRWAELCPSFMARAESTPIARHLHDPMLWFVAQTSRYREQAVELRFVQLGFETYVPLFRPWPRPPIGRDVSVMFPGYVFVNAPPRDLYRVDHTPGVRGVVAFAGEAARVDPEVLAFLRAREGADGVISAAPLNPGKAVRIVAGPLQGLEAVIEMRLSGRERIRVLLEILHRQTRVELPERWVRPA